MTHTRGPWDRDGLIISKFGRGVVARVPTPQGDGVFQCSDNARLIAAAPELLKALQALAKRHEGWEHGCGPCVCEAHEQARVVITKATNVEADTAGEEQ